MPNEPKEFPDIKRRLFTREEVAHALFVSVRYLDTLRERGILNDPVDAAGPKWTEKDIDDAIKNLEIEREEKKTSAHQSAPVSTDAHTRAKSKPTEKQA
jgi:hypothetical protein